MQYGVQLFGLRKKAHEDPEALFAALAQMGYQLVEPCVVFGESPDPFFWTAADYDRNLPLWRKHGLNVLSCHALTESLPIQTLAAFANHAGLVQLVLNCPSFADKEAAAAYARRCILLADALRETGTDLLLHNSREASQGHLEGKSVYEWVLDACGANILAQPDIGWLACGNIRPSRFLWQRKEQIRSLHYQPLEEAEAVACFQFARAMGIPQMVDQDQDNGSILQDMQAALARLKGFADRRDHTRSILCVYDVGRGQTQVLKEYEGIIEAPNWLQGEESLVYNSAGQLYRYDMKTGMETRIDTGNCDNCNNDHVLSPDQKTIALSHAPAGTWQSRIYTVPLSGGQPVPITQESPSFLHGWSPDGKELAYCGFRGPEGEMSVDIYTTSAMGDGHERRLTFGEGFNDGPEYAPNGSSIWFNSTRSGLMQIWRMERDGSSPIQMTTEDRNCWFAHLSPDGEKLVYLAYRAGDLDPEEHLPNMNVELWLMSVRGGEKRKLFSFFGGQGSLNVNSWACDSRRFAFVGYELLDQQEAFTRPG